MSIKPPTINIPAKPMPVKEVKEEKEAIEEEKIPDFFSIYADRNPKQFEMKILKEKISGKILKYDFMKFHNKTLPEILSYMKQNGYMAMLFVMKNKEAREWVALNLNQLKTDTIRIAIISRNQPYLEDIEPNISCKWRYLSKIQWVCVKNQIEQIKKLNYVSGWRKFLVWILNLFCDDKINIKTTFQYNKK